MRIALKNKFVPRLGTHVLPALPPPLPQLNPPPFTFSLWWGLQFSTRSCRVSPYYTCAHVSVRVWVCVSVCQFCARGQWQKFLLRLDKVSVRYNLQYFSLPQRTQVKVFGLAKKYGFNDNDFSRAKSGAKFRIRQRNALGIFKMPNSKSFPHTLCPTHPLPRRNHFIDTCHTRPHTEKIRNELSKKFFYVLLVCQYEIDKKFVV